MAGTGGRMSGEKAPGRGYRVALSVGLAVALAGVGLLFVVWGAVAERDAYRAAEPCGARTEQECVRLD
ncbi:hypothetical protein ADL35_47420, partial [Streptomyces sp. NRRL WC-3753]